MSTPYNPDDYNVDCIERNWNKCPPVSGEMPKMPETWTGITKKLCTSVFKKAQSGNQQALPELKDAALDDIKELELKIELNEKRIDNKSRIKDSGVPTDANELRKLSLTHGKGPVQLVHSLMTVASHATYTDERGRVHYGPLYPRSSGSEGYLTEGIDTIFEKLETAQEKLDLLHQILTWISKAKEALTPKQ